MPNFIVKAIVSISDGRKGSTTQGRGGAATQTAEFVRSTSGGTAPGQAQARSILLRRDIVNSAAFLPIFVNGVDEEIFVKAFSSYFFKAIVTGRSIAGANNGASSAWEFTGIVQKNNADGGGPAVLTPLTKTFLGASDNTLTWDADCQTAVEDLQFMVQGDAANTIRWLADVTIQDLQT